MGRKHWLRYGFVVVGALLVTACADQASSPLEPGAISAAKQSASTSTQTWQVGDTLYSRFNVTPAGGLFNIVGRKFRIDFPVNAICDIQTSTYGPQAWDEACVPETETVQITTKIWLDADDHPHIDFQPAMRFSPALVNGVTLYLRDRNAQYRDDLTILYCVTTNGCYDESLTDPSLATRVDADNVMVYRRIKHFSGSNVTAGRTANAVDTAVEETVSLGTSSLETSY
jgi:hypothetical protein